MSTFSGISTAVSSLIAQRQALEVSGQNIANANTRGYTRQRADLSSVTALATPSMTSTPSGAGNGVRVSGITRIGDVFLDARVRTETAGSSFHAAQATTLGRLESTITEPADTGVAAGLQQFWSAWQDVGNNPGDAAARKVLLGDASALVSKISSGYRAVETQWDQMRTETDTLAVDVNTTAEAVAQLNEQIRAALVSGSSPNELVDQRNTMVTELSALIGATGREREDGTLDVMVGGNALVRGATAYGVAVTGSRVMGQATAVPASDPDLSVRLVWTEHAGTPLEPTGGRLTSHLSALSATGPLASAATSYNELAKSLATTVNTVHRGGQTAAAPPADTDVDFFVLAGDGTPAATGLSVIDDPDRIAAGGPGLGGFDGSVADAISQLAELPDGPDSLWRAFVVDVGVQTRAADQRATVTEAARATAENLQLSQASVDLDEETVNMLAFQRAYEGAARVLTAIDEMLDVLINRTGVVGR